MATPYRLKAGEEWTGATVPERSRNRARIALKLALAVLAVSVAAQLAVPIPGNPVPVSLQDLVVLAVGIVLGPVQGAGAVVAYVAMGALGAPIFAEGHGGFMWLMGPTGGYLLAFPATAWVAGVAGRLAVGRARGVVLLAGLLAAQAVLFTCGTAQLGLVLGVGLSGAVALAVTPFVPGIVVKTVLLMVFGALLARRRQRGEPSGHAAAPAQ